MGVDRAHRRAADGGADWLDLREALQGAADPDAALMELLRSATDLPEITLRADQRYVAYLYRSALADLSVGDAAAASFKVGLLSRCYAGRGYRADLERLIDFSAETSFQATPNGHTQTMDVRDPSAAVLPRATTHSFTGSSLHRMVDGLADIITTLHTTRLEDVRSYGAVGDGMTDDTAAVHAAMAAAADAGTGVHIPRGTYRVDTVAIPDGVLLRGDGPSRTWLKGGVLFGSRDLVIGLRLGDTGHRTHNRAEATETTFEDCRFRGTVPILLGDDNSCSHIVFRDCEVERSFGHWTPSASYNNIIIEEYSPGPGGHVEHITFERCHVGVSNGSGGRDTGSPSAGLVAYCNPQTPVRQGYKDIRIVDCVFEATDEFTLDFDDKIRTDGSHSSSDVLIQGCVIKGAGVEGRRKYAYSICIESPEGCVVRDNLIYRGYINTFKICKNEDPDPDRRPLIVERNMFDLTVDNGVDPPVGASMIRLHGDNTVFRDNTIVTDLRSATSVGDAPGAIFKLYYCRGSLITGNRVYDRTPEMKPLLFHLYASHANIISSNYFWSSGAGGLGISSQADSEANTFTDNTFAH